jgi:hypothetical protein
MAEPLATDEMRRRLALAQDRQHGIDTGDGRGLAVNQWLPFSTNRVGSASWVTEGRNPQWAVPQVVGGGLLGVAGAADAPRTGKLTPETLGLLLTSGPTIGGLLAPRGALVSGAVGAGERRGLVVGARLPDGTIEVGKPGQIHAQLSAAERYNPGQADYGFIDPSGRYLTRAEAIEWVRQNQPKTAEFIDEYGKRKNLEARDYNFAAPHEALPMKDRVY